MAPAVGQLHRRDVPKELLAEASFDVVVVGRWGGRVSTRLFVAELWQSGGWSRCLGCPGCGRPVRLLRVVEARLLCQACAPPRSAAARLSPGKRKSLEASRERAERRLISVIASEPSEALPEAVADDFAVRMRRAQEGALTVVEEVTWESTAAVAPHDPTRADDVEAGP